MRTDYNFLKIIKNFINFIRIKFKPLTVHLESIIVDEVWEEIKKKVLNNEVLKWYVMTPANYEYFISSFKIKMSRKEISEIMIERYKWMLEHKQKLELHIHLSITEDMSFEAQEQLFKEAINWLKKEVGIDVKEFVPGWWAYNDDTLRVLNKLGLKMIKYSDYNSTHDYHWVLGRRTTQK
jgi:hypothetical protein